MSLAAETRRSVARHPFLLSALRAGVVNYKAAARYLDVDGDVDAVAAALRRYAADLPPYETVDCDGRVTMQRGIGRVDSADDAIVLVGSTAFGETDGELTALLATGEVDVSVLSSVLAHFDLADLDVSAISACEDTAIVVVDHRDGADALRAFEQALETVPA